MKPLAPVAICALLGAVAAGVVLAKPSPVDACSPAHTYNRIAETDAPECVEFTNPYPGSEFEVTVTNRCDEAFVLTAVDCDACDTSVVVPPKPRDDEEEDNAEEGPDENGEEGNAEENSAENGEEGNAEEGPDEGGEEDNAEEGPDEDDEAEAEREYVRTFLLEGRPDEELEHGKRNDQHYVWTMGEEEGIFESFYYYYDPDGPSGCLPNPTNACSATGGSLPNDSLVIGAFLLTLVALRRRRPSESQG